MSRWPQWPCEKCGELWPAYTVLEAFRKRKRASKVHPGEECKVIRRDQ